MTVPLPKMLHANYVKAVWQELLSVTKIPHKIFIKEGNFQK